MRNYKLVNELAMRVQEDKTVFNELYLLVEPEFKLIVEDYMVRMNLVGFNFDRADYVSIVGQAFWESLDGYDSEKGNFMNRLVLFARKRMKEVTDYNLRKRRFDKSRQTVSYEELFESEEFDIETGDVEINETQKIINNFIKSDKEGKVVEILLATSDNKLRNKAFTQLFGQYGATERKKVQRVKERLEAQLLKNGIYV